jgi:hypothetical protein
MNRKASYFFRLAIFIYKLQIVQVRARILILNTHVVTIHYTIN